MQQRAPIPRLSTADARRERQLASRSSSVNDGTPRHLPFASINSTVYLSTARPGYIRKPQHAPVKDTNPALCSTIPGIKPPLLLTIEEMIDRGVKNDSGTPSEQRLSVFRDAFESFLNGFGPYKGVLSRIKGEYQALLDHYAEQVRYIAPLKMRLKTIKADADAHVASEQLEIFIAEQQKLRDGDQKAIGELKQVIEALKAAVSSAETRLGDETTSRKTLSDALKRHKAMLETSNSERINLTRALSNANQTASAQQVLYQTIVADLDAANQKIAALEARLDVASNDRLTANLKTLSKKHDRLQKEFKHLLNLYEQATTERSRHGYDNLASHVPPSLPGLEGTHEPADQPGNRSSILPTAAVARLIDDLWSEPFDDIDRRVESRLAAVFPNAQDSLSIMTTFRASLAQHPRFRLVLHIVDKRLPPQAFLDFREQLHRCMVAMGTLVSESSSSPTVGTPIPLRAMFEFIDEFFGETRTDVQLAVLKDAARHDAYPAGNIVYPPALFEPIPLVEDLPRYMAVLAEQYIDCIETFQHKFLKICRSLAGDGGRLTVEHVDQALAEADPAMSAPIRQSALKALFTADEQDEIAKTIGITDLEVTLTRTLIKPVGKVAVDPDLYSLGIVANAPTTVP
ncbi:hypothetical protein PBRA_007759 [Plasmodiophora brassicae]|uniref:Translin-associated factor X-interacting protein 1 N-terminal domain-containing protein n=1 Tax=Plasmodiophora brassicae TaxID=37360 RepID=A0A0G4IXH3_PLABS|nr:hypothetical protein PBRA_007759 [Plasmodiophora brassicae]